MVKCRLCKKDMLTADSCIENKTIAYSDGSRLPAIKYKGTSLKELEKSLKLANNPKYTESLRNKLTAGIKVNIDYLKKNPNEKLRCHDCRIKDGGYHHLGCDAEVCPRCKTQLITCNCKKK